MNTQNIESKIAKLLKLAGSSNAHEAAVAFGKAQELAMKHALDIEEIENAEDEANAKPRPRTVEKVAEVTLCTWGRAVAWKTKIANALGTANRCGIYMYSGKGGSLEAYGQPADLATVKYMFDLIVREIDRLTSKAANGQGRTWGRNFRLGAADEISRRLVQASRLAIEDARIGAREIDHLNCLNGEGLGNHALARVDSALEHFKAVDKAVDRYRAGLGLNKGRGFTGASSYGYGEGRNAGASVGLGGGRAIGSGSKGLN